MTIVDDMGNVKWCHVTVLGLVQGVGFRYYTQQQALALGVQGWVRNQSDGSVEVFISGDDEAVAAMLTWLKHGPPSAVVNQIKIKESDEMPACSGFKIAA